MSSASFALGSARSVGKRRAMKTWEVVNNGNSTLVAARSASTARLKAGQPTAEVTRLRLDIDPETLLEGVPEVTQEPQEPEMPEVPKVFEMPEVPEEAIA